MKKILFIVLLLVTAQTFAQEINVPRTNDKSSYGKYSMMQSASGDTVLEWTIISPANQFTSDVDTLSGASDTVTYDFGHKYAFAYIVLRDTGVTTAAGVIDSVKIEVYHSDLAAWSSQAVGLVNVATDDLVAGTVVVPGTGLIKTYLLNKYLYPGQVRITWVYGADKANRKMPVMFRGVN